MEKTGKQRTAGFTLVEVIVAIAIMGLVSAPICASLVLAGRINARSRAVMEAQLHVRAAVETLMEEGVKDPVQTFSDVKVTVSKANASDPYYQVTVSAAPRALAVNGNASDPYYQVTVSDDRAEPLVTVDTYIHAAPGGGGA